METKQYLRAGFPFLLYLQVLATCFNKSEEHGFYKLKVV